MSDQGHSLTGGQLNQLERETSDGGNASDLGSLFGDEESEVEPKIIVSIEVEDEYSPAPAANDTPREAPGAPLVPQMGFSSPQPPISQSLLARTSNAFASDAPASETATPFVNRTEEIEDETSTSPEQKNWLLNDEKIALIAERDEALRECDAAKRNRDIALDDVEGMEKAVVEVNREIGRKEGENQELIDQIEYLKAELGKSRGEISNAVSATAAENANEISSMEEKVRTLENSIAIMTNEADHIHTEMNAVKGQLKEMTESRDSLQQVVDSLEAELEVENRYKFRSAKEMESIKEQLDEAISTESASQKALTAQALAHQKLEEHIHGLQGLLTASSQQITILKSSCAENDNLVAVLRKELAEKEKAVESLGDEVRAEREASRKVVEDTAERLTEKDRLLAEAIQKKFDTKARAENVMSAVEIKAREDAEGNLGAVEREKDGLEKELVEAKSRIVELEEQSIPVATTREKDGLEKELVEAKARIVELEEQSIIPVATTSSQTDHEVDANSEILLQQTRSQLEALEAELSATKSELELARTTAGKSNISRPRAVAPPPQPTADVPAPTPKAAAPPQPKPRPPTPKPRRTPMRITKPKPIKHYWNPHPSSARDAAEPAPTPAMQAEAAGGNMVSRWFVHRAPSVTTEEGLVGGVFDVKKGWQKERVRVKRELKPRVEGSRVSGRSTKGVGPERWVEFGTESEAGGPSGKRRRIE